MGRSDNSAQVRAFLASAKSDPADDAPRLALADWLIEHGDAERGEFIALQCRLAVGSPCSWTSSARADAQRREAELLDRCGGAWLGPLWRQGGVWHRGLLSIRCDGRADPDRLKEVFPWIDTLTFDLPGAEALRQAPALLGAAAFNHVALVLRRSFRADRLLATLRAVGAAPCLRSLTFGWPPALARRTEAGAVPAFGPDFLAALTRLPLTHQLTHLGSNLPWTSEQDACVRAAGVIPVWSRGDRHWPHALPVAVFRRRV